MSMNTWASSGTKVRFVGGPGRATDDQEFTKGYLKVGEIYTVERTDPHDFYTYVFLKEVPGVAFNSVLFDET